MRIWFPGIDFGGQITYLQRLNSKVLTRINPKKSHAKTPRRKWLGFLDSRFRGNDENGCFLTFYEFANIDGLVKSLQGRHSRERGSPVPLKTGSLDSRVRGNDENGEISTFYEFINISLSPNFQFLISSFKNAT